MATQVFFVSTCQPKALQVDIGSRYGAFRRCCACPCVDFCVHALPLCSRFFLSPGDHFFVPVSSLYRLQNHSSIADAEVVFVVINSPSAGAGTA